MFQTTNQVLVAGCCWWTNPHYRFCEDHSELDPFGLPNEVRNWTLLRTENDPSGSTIDHIRPLSLAEFFHAIGSQIKRLIKILDYVHYLWLVVSAHLFLVNSGHHPFFRDGLL